MGIALAIPIPTHAISVPKTVVCILVFATLRPHKSQAREKPLPSSSGADLFCREAGYVPWYAELMHPDSLHQHAAAWPDPAVPTTCHLHFCSVSSGASNFVLSNNVPSAPTPADTEAPSDPSLLHSAQQGRRGAGGRLPLPVLLPLSTVRGIKH